MKAFATCSFVALLSGALGSFAPSSADLSSWEEFKSIHGKQHSLHEDGLRMRRFLEKKAHIEAHNARYEAGLESFSLRLNQYSDLSPSEIAASALGFTPGNETVPVAPAAPMGDIPVSLDFRKSGIMTPVRSQGSCGSCYAFASAGVLEPYLVRKLGQAYDLSEQDVVDCSFQRFVVEGGLCNGGCGGGHPSAVFEYYNRKDLVFENEYRYFSGQTKTHGACRAPSPIRNVVLNNVRYKHVMLQNENDLKYYLVNYGPVVLGMAADNEHKAYILDLGNGIFDVDYTITLQPNHVVVLMGYGSENGKNFWIIKNSWGTQWGAGGYGRIIAGKNMANIMTSGIWYLE